jgi:hypothetical protein
MHDRSITAQVELEVINKYCSVASLVKHFLALCGGPGMPVGANNKAAWEPLPAGEPNRGACFLLRYLCNPDGASTFDAHAQQAPAEYVYLPLIVLCWPRDAVLCCEMLPRPVCTPSS